MTGTAARDWMRAVLYVSTWLLLARGSAAAPANPRSVRVLVDPRVELFSIVFRLAGNPEYRQARVPEYAKEVDAYFGRFRDHRAIALARTLRATCGISYDACMSMAVFLADPYKVDTRLPLDPRPECLDRRWPAVGTREFLDAVRQLVKESDFARFVADHRELYRTTEARMRALLESEAHLDWFDGFFGARPNAEFAVVVALLNGPSNYGPHSRTPEGKEDLYCILGAWRTDDRGLPTFDRTMLPTVVHEFCHSYANAIVDRRLAELAPSGKQIYPLVADTMRAQAYGNWETMMRESLVRACVLRYTQRYDGPAAAAAAAQAERRRGFHWVGKLAELLAEYEGQRDRFPNLDAFAPRMVAFYGEYAPVFVEEQKLLAARRPKVVNMTPVNGSGDVDPNLEKIEVVFDRPMQDQSWSMVGGGPKFPQLTGKPAYNAERKIWSVAVRLRPESSYEFSLNSERFSAFRSADGTPLAPVKVTFRTGKQR